MKRRNALRMNTKTTLRTIETLIEILVLTLIYFLVWRWLYKNESFPDYLGKGKYVLMGVYGLLSGLLISNMDGFRIGDYRRFDLAMAQWIGLFMSNFITYFQLCLIANVLISPIPMLLLMAIDVAVVIVFVYVYNFLYFRIYPPYNMIMIYGNDNAVDIKIKMDRRHDKYHINKLIPSSMGLEQILQELRDYDAVVINDIPAQLRNDIVKYCYSNEIRVYAVPKITDLIMRGANTVSTFDTPMVVIQAAGLNIGQRILKRTLDIILCLIGMIVAAPVMLVVAIAIKIEDGGPVFYTQKRATIGGKEFDILKFRSMIVDAEKAGQSIPATGHDPRITKVGRVIRACRVDELPQILNILKGDMSIVGPRPERLEHVEKYSAEIPEFAYRLKVKGGLTGYAQIYGKYNTSAYDKVRLDLMYIENYSFLLDIKLILLTIRILFSKESTEGFEEIEKKERQMKETLDKLHAEQEEDLTSVGGR